MPMPDKSGRLDHGGVLVAGDGAEVAAYGDVFGGRVGFCHNTNIG